MTTPVMKTRNRYKWRPVDGILLLDKPAGMTSNAALQKAKYLYGAEKAGHAGSLDPMATGLLPIFFGQGTKLCAFLLEADKCYQARVRLGEKTTTGDADGEVIARTDPSAVTEDQLRQAMAAFNGPITQIPPMYSSVRQQGVHLYQLARQGLEVERAPRAVTIHQLALDRFNGLEFEFTVHCSKGTYIRTLAEDWGAAVGQHAHLTALRRIQTGPFVGTSMVTPEALEACRSEQAQLDPLLLPLADALPDWPKLRVNAVDARRLRAGLECGPYAGIQPGPLAVLDELDRLLFIADADLRRRVAPRRWLGPEMPVTHG